MTKQDFDNHDETTSTAAATVGLSAATYHTFTYRYLSIKPRTDRD